jgi:hypothetical protein
LIRAPNKKVRVSETVWAVTSGAAYAALMLPPPSTRTI